MDKYQNEREAKIKETDATIFKVNPGETVYNPNYTQIKVGLTLYKYSSDYFFVAFVYDWLTPPPYTLLDNTDGAVGLDIDSGLSINGSTYAGRVTYCNLTSGVVGEKTTYNGGLQIDADSANAIGYAFSLPFPTSDVYGVISCSAYKSMSGNTSCAAFGEYDSVSFSLDLKNITVSFPAGISFNALTTRTRYTFGDSLNISNSVKESSIVTTTGLSNNFCGQKLPA